MTEIRKKIIDLIKDHMDKTLDVGCLFWLDVLKLGGLLLEIARGEDQAGTITAWNFKHEMVDEFIEDDIINCDRQNKAFFKIKIIGHYDISAVLKFIKSKGLEYMDIGDCIHITDGDGKGFIGEDLPLKPLHLYEDREENKLLKLLKKLK